MQCSLSMQTFSFCVPHSTRFIHSPSIDTVTLTSSRVLNNYSVQALRLLLLDIDSLHVAVQLLLGALLVVSLSADTHAQSVGDAFDAALPDFLVQLRVKTDVAGTLQRRRGWVSFQDSIWIDFHKLGSRERGAGELRGTRFLLTIDSSANFLISLIALGARFLNATPWTCCSCKENS